MMATLTHPKNEMKTQVLHSFDATSVLNSPFKVVLIDAVYQSLDDSGNIVDTVIPNPDGLLKAVAQARVLHPHKLNGKELKFLRSALGVKANYFARRIALSPEHLSRCEAGVHPLKQQSEMLARIFVFVSALPFTSKRSAKAAEIGGLVSKVFEEISIKAAHPADDRIEFEFVLDRRSDDAGPLCPANDDDEVWDQPPLKCAIR